MSKFLCSLGDWFERQKRVLPWRDRPEVYRVWISEIMLQQTQVVTVVPYFERFLARFPTVESLASAREEDVLLNWAGLGYYSRARNIHRAAQQIVKVGRFPETREEWNEIPGVGPYTAGAILSIAFDLPEAILDGNVERVISRLREVDRGGGDAAYKAKLWDFSKKFVTDAHRAGVRPSVTNQALMELGATICTPRKPRCEICPIASACQARRAGTPDRYPPPKKPKEWLQVEEKVLCLIDEDHRVLLRKRAKGEWRAGLWDLPAELPKELANTKAKPRGEHLGNLETRHVVTRHQITRLTEVWRVRSPQNWRASETAAEVDLRWVSMATPDVAIGSALVKTLGRIRERFAEFSR